MEYQLSEREKRNRAEADKLNAILSMSSIKEGSEAAQVRAREQAARRLRRPNTDMETLLLKESLTRGSGRFQGTSMEAQMLNIWNDPSIPDGDPRKQQAQRYLSRPTTYAVGDTTYVRQGVLGGPDEGTDKVRPEQRAAANAVALGEANAAVAPGAGSTEANWWDAAVAQVPFLDERFYQSQAWKDQQVAAEAWTETFAKTVKGGGQVTDDDRKQVRTTYWPTESDDASQIAKKALLRANVEAQTRRTAQGVRDDATSSTVIDFNSLPRGQ